MRRALTAAALALAVLPWVQPGPATAAPPAPGPVRVDLAGRLTTLQVDLDDAGDAPVLRVVRRSDGEPPVTQDVPAGGLSVVVVPAGDLLTGRAYTFSLSLVDDAGAVGPAREVSVVGTERPVPSVPAVTTEVSPDKRFTVRLDTQGNGRNADDTRYSLFYRPLPSRTAPGTEPIQRWVTGSASDRHVFGGPTGPGVLATRAVPGVTYQFIGVATDRFGNRGEGVSGQVVVPLDQTSALLSGRRTSVPRSGAYGGTSAVLQAAGAQLSAVVAGEQVQLVGEHCPTCGAFEVRLDGVLQARVDTVSTRRSARGVLWTGSLSGQRRGRTAVLTVRASGTPGRPSVVLDAVAVRTAVAGAPLDGLQVGGALLPGSSARPFDPRSSLLSVRRQPPSSQESVLGQTVLQGDGNLVVYAFSDDERTRRVVLQSRTRDGAVLAVQRDGNVVLSARDGRALWQTRTAGSGRVVLLQQADGDLVVRRVLDGAAVWSARTGRS